MFFKGEPFVETDGPLSAPGALSGILTITMNEKGKELVEFMVVLTKGFTPTENVYKPLIGMYKTDDQSIIDF